MGYQACFKAALNNKSIMGQKTGKYNDSPELFVNFKKSGLHVRVLTAGSDRAPQHYVFQSFLLSDHHGDNQSHGIAWSNHEILLHYQALSVRVILMAFTDTI